MNRTHKRWSEADFSNLSWHDNHVHGIRVLGGDDGPGELVLDLDYIVEWIRPTDGPWTWRIAPATLTFHQVMDLRVEIDYAVMSIAVGPLSIGEITREPMQHLQQIYSYCWSIMINSPNGAITFKSPGFTQVLRAIPFVSDHQCLEVSERT